MIAVFHGDADVAGYCQWVANNPKGFVLFRHWNNGDFEGRIHKAGCRYVRDDMPPVPVAVPPGAPNPLSDDRYKACSNDLAALEAWGRYVSQGLAVTPNTPPTGPCSHCP